MIHKSLRGIEEVHYCFSRSSIPFQGHTGLSSSLGWSQLSNSSDLRVRNEFYFPKGLKGNSLALGYVVILKVGFLNSLYNIVAWAVTECHRTSLMNIPTSVQGPSGIESYLTQCWCSCLLPWMASLGLNKLTLISMGQCKKDVTPLLTHWNCVFFALTHRYVLHLLQAVFVFMWVQFSPLTYNKTYEYPAWAQGLGLTMAFSSMVCIPGFFVIKLLVTPGSLKEVSTPRAIHHHVLSAHIQALNVKYAFTLARVLFKKKNVLLL